MEQYNIEKLLEAIRECGLDDCASTIERLYESYKDTCGRMHTMRRTLQEISMRGLSRKAGLGENNKVVALARGGLRATHYEWRPEKLREMVKEEVNDEQGQG